METLKFVTDPKSKAGGNWMWFDLCTFVCGFFLYMVLCYYQSVQGQGFGVYLKCVNIAVGFIMVFPNGAEPEVVCSYLNRKGQKGMIL